ncbi:MAG: heparan-alpha-glucosaminide N-acetyltransferase domain-containing protein, partial [Acidobacteria bacterium]|nr:heparan-alpha-glucosaminide N-acetyltransferase domain-containing protein [Acidobacteriota bacterium]
MTDVPLDDPIFSSQFVVTKVPQITNIGFWRRSRGRETSERGADSRDEHFRAIRDARGRIMVVMTHNTDIAESWEREGEDPGFFFQFSPDGYQRPALRHDPLTGSGSPVVGVHAHRVIFIDLARAMAVVLMVSGHTSTALLSYAYRTGEWIDVWEFQRGLTSVLFLLLAGFAFSVATARHWSTHTHVSGALLRRLRRFGLFIVLGYGLHFPVPHVAELAAATDQQWRSFLAVDVLQLIGATFIVVQALVMIVRTERAFTASALVLATAVVVAAPTVQGIDWVPLLPLSLAAYM